MHAFSSKMGAYHPFPINIDQLFYVILKGYVAFLLEDKDDIDDKNETGLLV